MTNETNSNGVPDDSEIIRNIDNERNTNAVPVKKEEKISDDEKAGKKRLERLEQNRISARESRKRKKTMIEELQRSVITLSRENKDLNEKHDALRRQLMDIATKFPAAVPNIQSILMMGPNTFGQPVTPTSMCDVSFQGSSMDAQAQAQATSQAHQTAIAAQQAVSDQDKAPDEISLNKPQQVVGAVPFNGMNMTMMGTHPVTTTYGIAPGIHSQTIAPQLLPAMAWQQQQFNQAIVAMQQAQQQQQVVTQTQQSVPQPEQMSVQSQQPHQVGVVEANI